MLTWMRRSVRYWGESGLAILGPGSPRIKISEILVRVNLPAPTASSCHSPVLAAVPLLAGLHHPTGVGLPLRAKLTTAGYSVGE